MTPTSWLEINLARLDANVAALREMIGDKTLLCGTVKADAYGLGVVPIARRLAARSSGGGIDMVAVFSPEQAEQLAGLSLPCPILVLMRMSELTRGDALYRHAATGRLHLTIHDREQVAELDQAAKKVGCVLPVHLYVDTGMSRSGLSAEQFADVVRDLKTYRHVRWAGVCTHLASADSDEAFTDEQMAKVDRLLEPYRAQLPADLMVHVANTAATLRHPRYHRQMVRVGLGLYGYGEGSKGEGGGPKGKGGEARVEGREPKSERSERKANADSEHSIFSPLGPRPSPLAFPSPPPPSILPILRWLSRVIHVQEYPKGTPVGYNSTHRLTRDSVLGLVPVGYADGYPRSLSNKSVVGLPECTADGKPMHAAVLGRVNMDQIVIDLTDAPASCGSFVELVSDDPTAPHALDKLAELAGSNCHEMLCRLSPRVVRRYL